MDRAKFQELVSLIERSSPQIAAKTMFHLDELNRSGKLDPQSVEELKNIARPKIGVNNSDVERYASTNRMFFEPFTLLFENKVHDELLPGSFPREKLSLIWKSISENVIKDEIASFESEMSIAIEEQDTFKSEKIIAQIREAVIDKIEISKDFGLLAKFNNQISKADAIRFYGLLKLEQAARDNNINLAMDIDQISSEKGLGILNS